MENEEKFDEQFDRNLKLLVKSSIIVFIGLFFAKIFNFLYRIVIARYFTPEIYGLFSLAVMVAGIFMAVCSFGFIDGILRYSSLYRGKKEYSKIKYLIKFSSIILFFSSILAGVILFFSSEFISLTFFHNSELIIFLKIFSALILFSVLSRFYLSIIQGFEEIGWNSFIYNILWNFSKLILLGFFILLGLNSNAIIFSYLLSFIIILLASYLVFKIKISKILKEFSLKNENKKINKEFISYSWPVMFSGIISTIFYWADSFLIGYFLGASEVGYYNVAVPIVLLLAFVPTLFMQLYFPLINKEFSRGNSELIKELSKQVSKWIFILNLPILLLLLIFPDSIITILFGRNYIVAKTSLQILSIGGISSCFILLFQNLLSMKGKTKTIMNLVFTTSLLNVILNWFLIPIYGIKGAAVSTTITSVLLTSLFGFYTWKYTSIIPLRKKMLNILVISTIPILIISYLKNFIELNNLSFILLSIFFILIYFLLILLTKCLDKNDFMILRSFKTKLFN